ncbi:MAG TPA: RsmE family RNA methyltransferase [Terriglobales bacterium]
MARRRFLADRTDNDRAFLVGQNALHLARVLRAEVGQQFEISTGEHVRLGAIARISEDEVELALGDVIDAAQTSGATLLIAVFKFDRFEWAIEKATELGCRDIVPLIARRTEKHLAQAAGKRVERWRRIAHEAAQQSRQVSSPAVHDPLPLKTALTQHPQGIVLSENEKEQSLWTALTNTRSTTFAIGPEGGWAPEELQQFSSGGWVSASLGTSILRAETAAIAALAIANQFALDH